MYSFSAILPVGVGEKASQDFGIDIAFAFEITVESAVRQVGTFHNLANGDIVEPIAVE
jgi:hypothetical protein